MIVEKDDNEDVNENLEVFDTFHELLRRRKRVEKYINIVAAFGNGGGSGVSNNSYVQQTLNRATALGYTLPNAAKITALNTFFDSISSLMSLAECIKIYALNDTLLSNFSTLNYVDPTSNQSTLHGSPTYSNNGYRSAGVGSYVNEHIAVNRRAGIQDDFSELVSTFSTDTTDQSLMMILGASTSAANRLNCLTKSASSMVARGYNDSGAGPAGTVTNHDGFYSICSKVSGTLQRCGKDNVYGDGVLTSVAPTGLADYTMYTCAWNNNGSVIREHTLATAEFRWMGYELSDTQVNTIRLAWEAYKTTMGLS